MKEETQMAKKKIMNQYILHIWTLLFPSKGNNQVHYLNLYSLGGFPLILTFRNFPEWGCSTVGFHFQVIVLFIYLFSFQSCACGIWTFSSQGQNQSFSWGYTTATAVPDLSPICGIHQILNPLSKTRDHTCILMESGFSLTEPQQELPPLSSYGCLSLWNYL